MIFKFLVATISIAAIGKRCGFHVHIDVSELSFADVVGVVMSKREETTAITLERCIKDLRKVLKMGSNKNLFPKGR